MNLNAVVDYLEEFDNPDASIIICPSDVDELTDENSIDEEGNVPIGPHTLNRNQLLAQAEIDLSSDDEIIQQPPCKKQKTLQPKMGIRRISNKRSALFSRRRLALHNYSNFFLMIRL